MELKKLIVQSLPEALRRMSLGETCVAPGELKPAYLRKTCSELKEKGYVFLTSMKSGELTVTRIK